MKRKPSSSPRFSMILTSDGRMRRVYTPSREDSQKQRAAKHPEDKRR